MKIRMIEDRRIFAGTPVDIVTKMATDAIFMDYNTAEDYMQAVNQRIPHLHIEGHTTEERCNSFLQNLVRLGAAEIVTE